MRQISFAASQALDALTVTPQLAYYVKNYEPHTDDETLTEAALLSGNTFAALEVASNTTGILTDIRDPTEATLTKPKLGSDNRYYFWNSIISQYLSVTTYCDSFGDNNNLPDGSYVRKYNGMVIQPQRGLWTETGLAFVGLTVGADSATGSPVLLIQHADIDGNDIQIVGAAPVPPSGVLNLRQNPIFVPPNRRFTAQVTGGALTFVQSYYFFKEVIIP